jgi:crotonobetainyl-CoA:carnitine CoA-transferase CaiB-like acyl-CoA transferase
MLYYYQMGTLGELLGEPNWGKDARFASEKGLRQSREVWQERLGAWLKVHTAAEIQAEGQTRHLLFTKVNDSRDLLESEHFKARNFFTRVTHPVIGSAAYPGAPFRLTGSLPGPLQAAPALGEANELILRQRLGYAREFLAELEASCAI